MKLKYCFLLILISCGLTAALVRYYFPKVQIKVQEKEVLKKDVRTVIKEVVRKDGTKETVTQVIDNSIDFKESVKEVIKEHDWFFQVSHGARDLHKEPQQSIGIYRRIWGPGFLGLTITTDRVYSVNVGLEF